MPYREELDAMREQLRLAREELEVAKKSLEELAAKNNEETEIVWQSQDGEAESWVQHTMLALFAASVLFAFIAAETLSRSRSRWYIAEGAATSSALCLFTIVCLWIKAVPKRQKKIR